MSNNAKSTQVGIEQRDRIVELVSANVDEGGDGLTRAELAAALGISKPGLITHVKRLIEDGRIQQTGTKITPASTGHIHICRTCGVTMH